MMIGKDRGTRQKVAVWGGVHNQYHSSFTFTPNLESASFLDTCANAGNFFLHSHDGLFFPEQNTREFALLLPGLKQTLTLEPNIIFLATHLISGTGNWGWVGGGFGDGSMLWGAPL